MVQLGGGGNNKQVNTDYKVVMSTLEENKAETKERQFNKWLNLYKE